MKKKTLFIGFTALVLTLTFTACPTTTIEKEKEFEVTPMPIITVHPTSADYLESEAISPLTVTVKTASAGNLNYQWYENTSLSNEGGTEIPGGNGSSYQPQNKAEAFYYVIVTNTGDSGTFTAISEPARIRRLASAPEPLSISLTVDTATTYQYVRGFGAATNVWGEPDVNLKEIEKLYNPDTGLGYNMLRVCLYHNLDDVVNNIEIPAVDRSDYFDQVKLVNRHSGYVLASPWTPPAEMKDPAQLKGGSRLRPDMYGAYARYLKEYAQRMYDEGAPIYALSIQNEPDYVANYDGCEWTAQEQLNFFKQVGRFTEGVPGWGGGKATPYVKILPGEPANNPQQYSNLMQDDQAASAIDIIGYHIYSNIGYKYTLAIDKGKETWMTEHAYTNRGDRFADPKWLSVWSVCNEVHHVIAINESSAFIYWWIKRFYGLLGDDGLNEGGGYRDYSYPAPPDGEVTWRGYALSHFAKYAKETRRVKLDADGITPWNAAVSADGASRGVHGTAYKTEDGNSISLVFYNQADTDVGDIQINLPSDFIAGSASAVITTSNDKNAMSTDNVDKKLMARHLITLLPGRKTAVLNFPKSCIISVKFIK
jgi:O-glycosyl hydrolase